jgi:hypothetical protein
LVIRPEETFRLNSTERVVTILLAILKFLASLPELLRTGVQISEKRNEAKTEERLQEKDTAVDQRIDSILAGRLPSPSPEQQSPLDGKK